MNYVDRLSDPTHSAGGVEIDGADDAAESECAICIRVDSTVSKVAWRGIVDLAGLDIEICVYFPSGVPISLLRAHDSGANFRGYVDSDGTCTLTGHQMHLESLDPVSCTVRFAPGPRRWTRQNVAVRTPGAR